MGICLSDLQMVAKLSGWPTPDHHHGTLQPEKALARVMAKQTNPNASQVNLDDVAAITLTGWNTPRATDGTHGGPNQTGGALPADVSLTGWATTPAARDYKSGQTADGKPLTHNARPLSEQALGATASSSPAATTKPAASVLNPAMSRWLQGFPATWDEASPGYENWRSVQQELTGSVG